MFVLFLPYKYPQVHGINQYLPSTYKALLTVSVLHFIHFPSSSHTINCNYLYFYKWTVPAPALLIRVFHLLQWPDSPPPQDAHLLIFPEIAHFLTPLTLNRVERTHAATAFFTFPLSTYWHIMSLFICVSLYQNLNPQKLECTSSRKFCTNVHLTCQDCLIMFVELQCESIVLAALPYLPYLSHLHSALG